MVFIIVLQCFQVFEKVPKLRGFECRQLHNKKTPTNLVGVFLFNYLVNYRSLILLSYLNCAFYFSVLVRVENISLCKS